MQTKQVDTHEPEGNHMQKLKQLLNVRLILGCTFIIAGTTGILEGGRLLSMHDAVSPLVTIAFIIGLAAWSILVVWIITEILPE